MRGRRSTIRSATSVGALALGLLLAACGSSGGDGTASGATATTAASSTGRATTTTVRTSDTMADGMPMGDGSGAKRPTNVTFDGPERAKLAAQLTEARAVALRYPTVADALAAGYELTTPYAPGTGAHYGKDADTQGPGQPLDVQRPQSLLYDGTDPDSKVVGLMYVQLGGKAAPDGFAGPLDAWNPFPGQCLKADSMDPVFPTKSSVTREECDAAKGRFIDVTAWIQHVWVVPGWEAPGGVFAPYNADIVCADGATETGPKDGCDPPALASQH